MWLVKRRKHEFIYQATFETLSEALKYIHKHQDAREYIILYVERDL
jgi:hypothetical protein